MSISITIVTKEPNRTYHPGDVVSGLMIIDCKSEEKYDGISYSFEGVLIIQMSSKSTSILAPSAKPIILSSFHKEIAKSGKLQAGRTQLPFEFTLKPNTNRTLYETFHGVNIVVQYILRCDIKKSLLAKDIFKTQEILVTSNKNDENITIPKPINFQIHPDSLKNVRDRSRMPKFMVKGSIDSVEIPIAKPITGEISVIDCSKGVSSIELQLLRVESCGSNELQTREVSEIQTIQICSGDVARNFSIPIYMKLPRAVTCATVFTPTFKIEFQMDLIIIFDNDHLVTETFPLKLTRH